MFYDTLKQRRFKAAIKHSKNKGEAALKAGYSPKSRTVFQQKIRTKSLIDEAFSVEDEAKIQSDFTKAKAITLLNGDMSNYLRANEDLARIKAMFKDKVENTNINIEQQAKLDEYYNRLLNKDVKSSSIN